MANPEHLAKLNEGVVAWNQWRREHLEVTPDLEGAELRFAKFRGAKLEGANLGAANMERADLSRADLGAANMERADLSRTDLSGAYLRGAYLHMAFLREANLTGADLFGATFSGANLRDANLNGADLFETIGEGADLRGADLRGAILQGALLSEANLSGANLSGLDLRGVGRLNGARLDGANLSGADFSGKDLSRTVLVETNLEGANLTGCNVYGVSLWAARLVGAVQSHLEITPPGESGFQMDNLELAQLFYLLSKTEKIRDVIDTISSKVVLILGRFKPERKSVLDAIRDELRKRDYLAVLFDFEKPASKDLTGTVSNLANMARFIIADLTDPSSVPHELAMVAPGTVVPIQTILLEGQQEYAMFADLRRRYHWVLPPYQCESKDLLIAHLDDGVIAPAEAKAKELSQK